eukprot:TRINITY_DN4919_c0_g1_i1.p1 TRINITY_DN4919_c0_g1~~TRINITY_DN4919_c0_g1_i1.p1  ORF type:complete len:325 (-),score=63.81 TRINITY_DN4919_c0_g1_i1:125-1099(-)
MSQSRSETGVSTVAQPSGFVYRAQQLGSLLLPGACAGFASAVACNPIDVLKNRLQSSYSTSSIRQELSSIFRANGISGFYAGLPASILSIAPTRAVYFALYNFTLRSFAPVFGKDTASTTAAAAAVTSVAINLVFSPIFVIRTLQFLIPASSMNRKASIPECVALVRRCAGWRGFWHGLSPSLIGVGETVTFWVLYETVRRLPMFVKHAEEQKEAQKNGTAVPQLERFLRWSAGVIGASVLARFVATIIWYPHEVLRTRMRESVIKMASGEPVDPPRLRVACREVFGGGVRTAWAGLSVHLFRQIPTTIVTWYVYEVVKTAVAN